MTYDSLGLRLKQQPPFAPAVIVGVKLTCHISITLLAEAAELGPACLAGKIDRYFARCDSACSTSDTEIARLRALRILALKSGGLFKPHGTRRGS